MSAVNHESEHVEMNLAQSLLGLARRHPEAAVLVTTGVGVLTGVLMSSLVDSNDSMERSKHRQIAKRLGQQLLDTTEGLKSPVITSLRDYFNA